MTNPPQKIDTNGVSPRVAHGFMIYTVAPIAIAMVCVAIWIWVITNKGMNAHNPMDPELDPCAQHPAMQVCGPSDPDDELGPPGPMPTPPSPPS